MKRRQFIEGCGRGLTGLWLASRGIDPAHAGEARAGREVAADAVIVGGGLGGCAAALAALGQGLTVVLTETTDWIGGQLTAQAVPPDEHPWIEQFGRNVRYHALRTGIRDYYRKNYPLTAEALADQHLNPGRGGVSRLCHEPRVALAVLTAMLAPYASSGKLLVLLEHDAVRAEVAGDSVRAVVVRDRKAGTERTLTAPFFIDATELGDLLPLAGVEFVIGAESQAETGEPHALATARPDVQQAITCCFAMDYLEGQDHTIDRPAEYDVWRSYAVAPPARIAFGFVLLAIAVMLVDNADWLVNRAMDAMVCGLCLLAMLMVSDVLYGWLGLFGGRSGAHVSMPLLLCLIGLTGAVTLRQAEHGVLSIFLGVGMGSNMARIFAPLLLVMTFGWEALNAKVGGQFGAAAWLAAIAAAVGTALLLLFAWRISRMENEIHDLILRDEATKLYNYRGFHLLAEHSLRLAKRTNVPFSVMFIEMENLIEIHEKFGPEAAGASLAEAGEIVRATFRESDIKGRIGAADFAIAGRFDRAGISVAALRLEAATAARASKTQGPLPLKLSMGHVTTLDTNMQESLKDLLERAGQAKNRMDLQMSEMRVN